MKQYPLTKVYIRSSTAGITAEIFRKGWRTTIQISLMTPSTLGRLQRALSSMPCVPRFDDSEMVLRYYPKERYEFLRSKHFHFD